MFKEWLTLTGVVFAALFTGLVGILVKEYFAFQKRRSTETLEAKEKRAEVEKATEIARIKDNTDFREEIWRENATIKTDLRREIEFQQAEIASLRRDLDNVDERLLVQVNKNTECERNNIRLEAKVLAQSDRIQLLEKQNIELNKVLLAANLSLPVASPIVLRYEDGGGEAIG